MLVEHGWTLKHPPGTFPLEMADKLGKQEMTQEIWRTRCEELGIASLEVWVQNEEEAQTA